MKSAAINPDVTASEANPLRLLLLAATSFAIGTLLIKSAIAPTAPTGQIPLPVVLAFPEIVPLTQWKLTESQSIAPKESQTEQAARLLESEGPSGDIVNAYQYRYESENNNNSQLTVNAYYLTRTDGDLKPFIAAQIGQVETALKQDATHGVYALFTAQDSVHITSCLNPRSPATVTSDQFSRNRMIYDARLSRLIPWLRGQQTLPDERCLWTQLSVSLSQYASEAAAKETIETAWVDWAKWWRTEL